MANDTSLDVRKAVVGALRADAALTALVPAAQIHGIEPPAAPKWPFVRYGFASVIPRRATCLDGCDISVAIHGFAKGPGEDAASAIGKAISKALDGRTFQLDGATADVQWTQTQIIRDGAEASAYHVIVNLRIEVSS